VLSMRLPFADRSDLDIFRKGDELYLRVGTYKRNLILPQTLQRLEVREAAFADDRLEVQFARSEGRTAGKAAGS
jgi:arsenite-transporting ATPase